MSRGTKASLVALSAAVAVGLGLAACTGNPEAQPTNPRSSMSATQTKDGTGEVRHDLEPLTKRFSALGTPVSATWMSGTLSGDAPGPSTYWIDAVVTLGPEAAQSLRDLAPAAASDSPDVPQQVKAEIPSGDLLSSPALDAKFAQGQFRAKVYLVEGTDTVVVVALGE